MNSATENFHRFYPETAVLNVTRLGNGHINETYRVDFTRAGQRETVVLQKLNSAIFPHPEKIAANINLVASHLRSRAYRYDILSPISSAAVSVQDSWRVLPYFDNCTTFLSCEDSNLAAQSARIFAHHLFCLSDLNPTRLNAIIPNFHNATHRWQQFEFALTHAAEQRKKTARQAIEFCYDHRSIIALYAQINADLPLRVTHNDTKISNLLFDAESLQPRVIIDLDTLQPGTVLSEFGDMLRSYCPSQGEEETNFEQIRFRTEIFLALHSSFVSELEPILSSTEMESLNHAGAITIFVQSLRFLSDYLNGNVYYRCSYEEQNLDRAYNQQHVLLQLLQWQKNQGC